MLVLSLSYLHILAFTSNDVNYIPKYITTSITVLIMIKESLLENLSIYNDNLSFYYLGSVFISVLSVVIAWWYHKLHMSRDQPVDQNVKDQSIELVYKPPSTMENENNVKIGSEPADDDDEIITTLKVGRQSLLAEKIAATLTEEQLREERQVEKQQLEAIFQLLQNQEDKFQVSSLEELEDQLRLYRH